MFPGVIEYDQPLQWVDLRGQVVGKTVASWNWDMTGASRAACISGTSTYKLRFMWGNVSPTESTATITVTATMTDSSTQSATLTFKIPSGPAQGTCPGTPASATWPAVLTPDKPAEQQSLLASDSATRPYAVSQESGALYVTHALPAYQPGSGSASAMHMPALGLTYSSIAAERRPIFIGRYELDPSANVPETVSARLKFNGTWGSSKYYDTSPSSAKWNKGDIMHISLQADAGSLATGRYSYDFETTANYSGSSTTTTSSGTVTIINEESSVFGEGWTLDIVDRIHTATGGVILNQGAGNSLWFAESGTSGGNTTYTTPAGDFSTLLKNNTTGVFTRTLKTGMQQIFNSSGYQTSLVDLNSNRVTFTMMGATTYRQSLIRTAW
jgi:hypothetical protein